MTLFRFSSRRGAAILLFSLVSIVFSSPTLADDYPARPIHLIVPYAPGGATDLMARLIQVPLAKALGQAVVVENRAGAAGAIGTRQVARSEPDGYTLLLGNNGPHTVLTSLSPGLGYDGVSDFKTVAVLGTTPLILVSSPTLPATTLGEFIAYARAHPGLAYGSSGVGSMSHLAMELFLGDAGITSVHIPYKGQAPTVQALLTGELPFAIVSPSPMLDELAKAARIRMLGVSTSTSSTLVPGVPAIATAVPGFAVDVWFAIFVPAATPPPIDSKLEAALDTALKDPQVKTGLLRIGAAPAVLTPSQLADSMVRERRQWEKIVREKSIKAE